MDSSSFRLTKTEKPNNSAESANEFKATAVLPYMMFVLDRSNNQTGLKSSIG